MSIVIVSESLFGSCSSRIMEEQLGGSSPVVDEESQENHVDEHLETGDGEVKTKPSASQTLPVPLPIPCKYFALGTCKFGYSCRFAHFVFHFFPCCSFSSPPDSLPPHRFPAKPGRGPEDSEEVIEDGKKATAATPTDTMVGEQEEETGMEEPGSEVPRCFLLSINDPMALLLGRTSKTRKRGRNNLWTTLWSWIWRGSKKFSSFQPLSSTQRHWR